MIDQLNLFCKGTFISHLGIEFQQYGENFIEATMPVDDKLQPMGVLHGGASLALAETIASAGSFLMVDAARYDVYGLQVSGSHVSTVRTGMVYARAEIIHKGRMTHIWDVMIRDAGGKLISTARVTNMVVEKIKQE